MRSSTTLPFQPLRDRLYSSAELAFGFDPQRPESLAETMDFQTFRYFVQNGRATPADPYAGMMEALHDNSILHALFGFLSGRKRIAAVMGGHREERGSALYRSIVELSKRLAEDGFLLASGGGPGAMEATHLGALLVGADQSAVARAIDLLATQPRLPPNAEHVVDASGAIDLEAVRALHAWAKPAHELMSQLAQRGESLAVPTWHYGHEPVTPLATHAAKFFQNSIREDVLLLLASQGIVYTPGRAGTLQEVFQDAAQNYYPAPGASFSPMVFFDADGFWSKTLPVEPLLTALFKLGGADREREHRNNVLFTADPDQVIEFLGSHAPTVSQVSKRLERLGMDPLREATLYAAAKASGAAEPSVFWSMDRHRLIGLLADELLTDQARRFVAEVLRSGEMSTLAEAAEWADTLRGQDQPNDAETVAFLANEENRASHARWHYLNLPFGATAYDTNLLRPFIPDDGFHVVAMIIRCAAAIREPTANISRANALRWLAHLLGDLHQPMHMGCGYLDASTSPPMLVGDPVRARSLPSDRGGNNLVFPSGAGGPGRNLHSYWDGSLGSASASRVRAAIASIPAAEIPIDRFEGVLVGWVEETLGVCKDAYWSVQVDRPLASDPRKVTIQFRHGLAAYDERNQQHVVRQMARAAVRLASLVNALLTN